MADVVVYGADWCSLTQNALTHLKGKGVDYEYINIDKDREAAKWVADQNDGKEKKPTLKVQDEVLTTPTNHELDAVLARKGIGTIQR